MSFTYPDPKPDPKPAPVAQILDPQSVAIQFSSIETMQDEMMLKRNNAYMTLV
jgi:hypothetical protein